MGKTEQSPYFRHFTYISRAWPSGTKSAMKQPALQPTDIQRVAKATFNIAKGGLLACKRPCFATRYAVFRNATAISWNIKRQKQLYKTN